MKFGVFGTGMVGLAISNRLEELGHEVMIGTRDPSKSAEKLKSKKKAVKVGTFAQAAAFGEVLVNATHGAASIEVLKMAGETNLDGKALVDIANPLDFSKGMPIASVKESPINRIRWASDINGTSRVEASLKARLLVMRR